MKFFILLFLISTQAAFADSWISSSSGKEGGSSKAIDLGFLKLRLLGGLNLGRASMESKDKFVEKRDMNTIGASAIFGANIGPLIIGLEPSYTQLYQATKKEDVSGTNTSGNLTQFAGAAGIAFGKLCLIGKYIFKADYKLTQKTATKETETFSKPDGAFGASLLYRPGGRSFWSLNYQVVNFTQVQVGSTKTKLSGNDHTINLTSFGLSYGFMF